MPIVQSSFRAPWFLQQGDVQTLGRYLFVSFKKSITYTRRRIDTPDGDFLDLDWVESNAKRLLVLSHGLEGSSESSYMLRMASAGSKQGWDVLAWNFRGCSGTPNAFKASYHSGKWDDLDLVIRHVDQTIAYDEIALIGFSVGGNITLRYLAHAPAPSKTRVIGAAVICAPVDLKSSATKMGDARNRLYMRWFLKLLKEKLCRQKIINPGSVEDKKYSSLKNFRDFDSTYTAPLFGFSDAEDYWKQSSSVDELKDIVTPTLIINPKDDPMLGEECYPRTLADQNPHLFLEIPDNGGHVGFISSLIYDNHWLENRLLNFLSTYSASTN